MGAAADAEAKLTRRQREVLHWLRESGRKLAMVSFANPPGAPRITERTGWALVEAGFCHWVTRSYGYHSRVYALLALGGEDRPGFVGYEAAEAMRRES